MCNAPATFSRLISLVLRGLSWKSVIAFPDDVVVMGRDFDSHMVNLSDVLRRFKQYGMKLKPKKCQLLHDSEVFLGRLVSREGVQAPPGEITRIGIWGVPLCKRDVLSFIGVLNRDHIPKFALVAKPLYNVMGPSSTFSWGTEQEKAFDALRQRTSICFLCIFREPSQEGRAVGTARMAHGLFNHASAGSRGIDDRRGPSQSSS